MLTGRCNGNVLTLRCRDVEGDALTFEKSKTGPQRVMHNSTARAILERRPRPDEPVSVSVAPGPRVNARPP